MHSACIWFSLDQALSTLVLEGHCPANFSSNPNQTHLNQLIKLFRITSKLQAGEFDQGWSKTLQDSGPPGPGLRTPGLDYCIINYRNRESRFQVTTCQYGGSLKCVHVR